MQQTNYIDNLLSLIRKATSQFHTVEAVKDQLAKQGYEELCWKNNWNLQKGGKYMVIHHGSSILHLRSGVIFKKKRASELRQHMGIFRDFVSNQIRR